MFGINRRYYNNSYLQIQELFEDAKFGRYSDDYCPIEIRNMLERLFYKLLDNDVIEDEENYAACSNLVEIAEAAKYLKKNTRNYKKMTLSDVNSLRKMFDELDSLFHQVITTDHAVKQRIYLRNKIHCIRAVISVNMADMHDTESSHENWRDGMLFQDYENLWKVLHRINTEWDDLKSRGFSLELFYAFRNAWRQGRYSGNEMSEDEKIEAFMSILDGESKIIPVYRHEHNPIGVKIVDIGFDDEIVYTSDGKLRSPHFMTKADETKF